MGSSGLKKKNNELINKEIKINEPIKITEVKNKNNRVKESIIKTSPSFEKLYPHSSDVSKSISKIKIEIK